jgi:hypothetical protein
MLSWPTITSVGRTRCSIGSLFLRRKRPKPKPNNSSDWESGTSSSGSMATVRDATVCLIFHGGSYRSSKNAFS